MVLGNTGRGGAQAYVMNVLRNIDHDKFQIDFAVCESKPDGYDDEMRRYGSKILYIHPFRFLNYLEYSKKWKEILSGNKYDIVEAHATNAAAFFLRIAKKEGIKTIAHSHSAGYRGNAIEKNIKKIVSKATKKESDYWFACSDLAAERLFGKKYHNYPRYYNIPNAIDSKIFRFRDEIRNEIRNELGIKDEIVIGHVGTFSEPKNHFFLLRVFHKLLSINSNYRLLLLGDGLLKEKVKHKVDELGLTNYVRFTGNVPNVNEYMMAMDIMVFPSLFEGFPVTLIEAQATGLPCIISDVITKEVDQTDLIHRLSLKDSEDEWVNTIVKTKNSSREIYNSIISETKYDVGTSMSVLMNIYKEMIK